ncbi:50S ribosome-binding GTPase [Nodosilinea sp. LEGE 06152]|uniref:GTPase family protein n=1 Tax=Nodosilinea sp. LEGE 06152 TaxID=2777966 RepID=UPI0018825F94|nr:50S ribosome-binding GTPase [Nodosilinea sp. LEGE 06152]MBE9160149.1 50S ribosome-binding GTPase [Nodosilinea sp. LEGE 06152]
MGDRQPHQSPSWATPLTEFWQQLRDRAGQLQPTQQLSRWFNVDDDRVAEILAAVREQLPTTEALLIGKPQAGKSSIVRGLTGVSAEIVGQGFKPHTQHTQRYAYPSEDLPLLIFTDTVGLGDIVQATNAIVAELVEDLNSSSKARILILTIKINDFATDTLRQVAAQLRRQFPTVPCLLVVTSAHEVYPPTQTDHPSYPPDLEAVQRPFEAIQANFEALVDRTVLIDFTLDEDGFDPVFYGLEALRDALADLLPAAEAQALYQLLDEQAGAADQLGNLYRDVGRHYISAFAVMAATLAAVPLPFATMPVLTALQISMVGLLGKLYGQTLSPSQAGGLISAIAGGFFAQAVGRELVKFIPGFGSVIAASWAAAYTWALGEGACVYFGDLMGGKKPDPQKIQAAMQEAFTLAKDRFKGGAIDTGTSNHQAP